MPNPLTNEHAPSRTTTLALLIGMVLLGVFPLDVILPSFPALSEHFGTPPADIALSISIFAIGVAASQFVLGPLSDKVGRKNLLIAGLFISILGALGCVGATDFFWFLFFRMLQALGCGCFVLINALVQDIFTGHERDKIRILLTSASGFFISVSPLAGIVLQHTVGWTGSFYVFSIIAGVILWRATRSLTDALPHSPALHSFMHAYRTLMFDKPYIGLCSIAAIAFTSHFSFIAISPIIFLDHFGLSQLQFALALLSYGAAYVLGGLVAAQLQPRLTACQQLLAGMVLIGSAGALLLALWAVEQRTMFAVLIPMMICTVGTTIARPAATSQAMDRFPASAGASASMLNTIVFVAGGVGSAAISWVAADSEGVLGLAFMVLALVGSLITVRLFRHAS